MKNKIIFLFIIILYSSCEPSITFKEPQPNGSKNLNAFPKRIIANYLSLKDSSLLNITSNSITKTYQFPFEILVSFADTTKEYKWVGDTLIDVETNNKAFLIKRNDTLIGSFNWEVELFKISAKNILRKLSGKYFLNKTENAVYWDVMELNYNKGKLSIGNISTKEELDRLVKITETNIDTTETLLPVFSPTRRQLRRFVRTNGFSNKEEFIKIK